MGTWVPAASAEYAMRYDSAEHSCWCAAPRVSHVASVNTGETRHHNSGPATHLNVPPARLALLHRPSYVEKLELHYDEAQLRKYEQLQELQQQAAAAAAARQAASALAAADAAAAARAGASPAAQYGLDVEDEEISMGAWDVFGE